MKKLNKDSIQNFMLLHAEKLILGGCLVLTGLFVYMSMGDGKGLTKTPSQLLSEADSAQSYVDRDGWEGPNGLKTFRKGAADAEEKIANAKPVDPDKFKLRILGTPAAALDARRDPPIFPAEQLIGRRITSGVMMNLSDRSPLDSLYPAPSSSKSGGSGTKSGGTDFDSDGRNFSGSSSGLPADYPTLERSNVFSEVNALTIQGIRPKAYEISAENIVTKVLDTVCVVAVVDFKKQVTAFEKAFAESVAFNAKRDRPIYQFVQVERKEVSDKETPWQDISEDVVYYFPQQCPPSLTKMPLQIFPSAPEVIAPENYDPILTGVIPAFVMLDYQKLASHPALTQRREFPAWDSGREEKPDGWGGRNKIPAGDSDAEQKDTNELRKGSNTKPYMDAIAMQKPGGQYRLVRFFDLLAPRDKTLEYRIRVWVGDPNQFDPTDGFRKNRGKKLAPGEEGEVRFDGENNFDTPSSDNGENSEEEGDVRREVVQVINKSKLRPDVRKRLKAATDLETVKERILDATRSGKPVERFQVAERLESGELEKIELPASPNNYAYAYYLRFARPSPWSEPVRVESQKKSADIYAGATVRGRTISMNAGAGEVEFELVEPSVDIVVSAWTDYLGAKLPSKKEAYVGETFDFDAPAYVTHPISWKILAAQKPNANSDDLKRFMMPFRTGQTVVDAFGGQELELPSSKRQTMATPTELLTMDGNGNLRVSNQFDSATNYRNEIAKPDSSRFYGTPRRSRKKDKEEEDPEF